MKIVIIVVIIIKYLLNFKGGSPTFFFFKWEVWKKNSLESGYFSKSVDLDASSISKRDLWLASSPSLSPPPPACSIGLASEQTEKSKEKRLGNQRGDSSQRTEQRGIGYGLSCHWSKQGKVSKRGDTCQYDHLWLETSDIGSLVCNRPREAHHVEHVNDVRLSKTPFFNLLDNEFTFKNVTIKFYKARVEWWWISKQCTAHDKLWIDIQVAEDVNGSLAETLVREDEGRNDWPLRGGLRLLQVRNSVTRTEEKENWNPSETWVKKGTSSYRNNSQVSSTKGFLYAESWFYIKLFFSVLGWLKFMK